MSDCYARLALLVTGCNLLHPLSFCSCRPSPCRVCRTCLFQVANWVKSTTQNMTAPEQAAIAFGTFCRSTGRPSALCNSIQTTIQTSPTASLAQRAGSLCKAFGECDFNQLAGCSLTSAANATLPVAVPAGSLDLCSSEGTSAGTQVLGVEATITVRPGRCLGDGDCGNSSYKCSTTSATQACTCTLGVDYCSALGYCVRTACKVCNDCLEEMRGLAQRVSTYLPRRTASETQ